MKNEYLLFVIILFLTTLTVRAVNVRSISLDLPVIRGVSESQSTEKFSLVGDFFKTNLPEIESGDAYSSDSPYYLFEKVLSVYGTGTIPELLNLYSVDTRTSASDFFSEVGEATMINHIRSINKFRVYGFWIENSNSMVFYIGINDTSDVIPYLVSFENGQWALVSGSIDSDVSESLDAVIAHDRWSDIQVTDMDTLSVSDILEVLSLDDFDFTPERVQF